MIRNLIIITIAALLLTTCARQTSPTGGPQDTIPPKLLSSSPQHRSINFSDNKIQLEFNELIQVNNPREQLIITPSVGKDFEMTAKKNTVNLEFEKPLQDSTTYTITFRESIQDLNEKNPARNLILAFSTGTYLDSLSIDGEVFDLLTGEPVSEATVALHLENDTFNILKHPATIIAKTNKAGKYKIDYLRPATYKLYAIADRNRNLIADSRTESYGFHSGSIRLSTDTANLKISLIRLDARPLKITSTRPYNTYYNIKFSKNIRSYIITAQDSLAHQFGEDFANIKVYNPKILADSIPLRITALDSIGNKLDTTLYAKFPTREVTREKFTTEISQQRVLRDKQLLEAKLTFSKPIAAINFDSITYSRDSLTTIKFQKSDITLNSNRTEAILRKQIPKEWYPNDEDQFTMQRQNSTPTDTIKNNLPILSLLQLKPASFISVESDSSASLSEKLSTPTTTDLSQIFYTIATDHKNLIIQLLDKNYNVLREQYQSKSSFDDLPAGDYLIRVIIDNNKNRQWDPGNYLANETPEQIYFVKNDAGQPLISLKTNWEYVATLLITSE